MTICPFKLRCTELLQNGNGNSLSAGQGKSTSHWQSNQKGAEKIIEKNKTSHCPVNQMRILLRCLR